MSTKSCGQELCSVSPGGERLENDRLLSPAVNQLKLERQIDLCAIAQAFLTLFDGEEDEVETYWLFSKFARKWESQQQHVSFLVSICMIF